MDILWLVLIFPIALVIGVIFDKDIKSVSLEKINVGERIMIKGEYFTILRYSPGGVIEARKDGTDDVFYIKTDKKTKFIPVLDNWTKRIRFYSIEGLKGTVCGEELDKIKFD